MNDDPAEQWRELEKPREIFRTRVLALEAEKFRCLRTGAEQEFISVRCGSWVNVIARTTERKILLIRQFRHGTKRTEWEIPGGCIDANDASPVEAGIRELMEETGFAGKNPRLIGSVAPNPAIQNNLCHTVFVEDAIKISEPHMEPTECIVSSLHPENEVFDMIRNGKLRHALVLDAFFYYFMNRMMENIKNEKCL